MLYRKFQSVLPLNHEAENHNFVSYVFLDKLFSVDELSRINSLWSDDAAQDAMVFLDGNTKALDYEQRVSKKIYIPAEDQAWIYDKLGAVASLINATKFKFDIEGFESKIAIASYTEGSFFNWHIDYGAATYSNRKFVIIVQLSDENDYEGGDLHLLTEKITAPRTKGSVTIFPSFIMHSVTPIVSGCRRSLIVHIGGPPFR
jgi:PKHD-type hydroxylase